MFGNIREQQENVENVFKYTGEQQDQETEQYYLGGILLQLYKFMEQKIKTNFYNVNFLIISNFIPFKMCKK